MFLYNFFNTELAFTLIDNSYGPSPSDRRMDELCEIFVECQQEMKGKCHGVVWCPIYNGGWNESHQSRRSREKVTREEMLNMLQQAMGKTND